MEIVTVLFAFFAIAIGGAIIYFIFRLLFFILKMLAKGIVAIIRAVFRGIFWFLKLPFRLIKKIFLSLFCRDSHISKPLPIHQAAAACTSESKEAKFYTPKTGIPKQKNPIPSDPEPESEKQHASHSTQMPTECHGCGAPLDMDMTHFKLICPYCDRTYPMPSDLIMSILDSRKAEQRRQEQLRDARIAEEKRQAEERERAERLEIMRRESEARQKLEAREQAERHARMQQEEKARRQADVAHCLSVVLGKFLKGIGYAILTILLLIVLGIICLFA